MFEIRIMIHQEKRNISVKAEGFGPATKAEMEMVDKIFAKIKEIPAGDTSITTTEDFSQYGPATQG